MAVLELMVTIARCPLATPAQRSRARQLVAQLGSVGDWLGTF